MAHVLIIDDERAVIRAIARLLLFGGHEIEVAETAEAAEKRLENGAYDIVLCDAQLGGGTVRAVYDQVVRGRANLAARFVFMTSGDPLPEDRPLLEAHPSLAKPVSMATLLAAIAQVVAQTSREA